MTYSSPRQRFADRCVIVTGAARGQGAAEARAFAAEGASVVVADVLEAEARAVAAELGARGRYIPLDVTDAASWRRMVAESTEVFGPVRVLVNNAGILRRGGLTEVRIEDFEATMAVNVAGVLLGMQAVAGSMTAAGSGAIVNISSVGGMQGTKGACAYVTSKWAVRGLTKAAASDLAGRHIRVNSVHPGAVETPMIAGDGYSEAAFVARYRDRMPIRRVGRPDEVAAAVLFLAADESSYITGAELTVDGGWMVT